MNALIQQIFDGLMASYLGRVAYARQALKTIQDRQARFINDHVAFRTFAGEHTGIAALETVFLKLGYKKRDYMHFDEKKLDAYWYCPPDLSLPKVFISELITSALSETSQAIIRKYTERVSAPINQLDMANVETVINYLCSRLWALPSYTEYRQLNEESEYAAWVLAYGNQVNHFTISVNVLGTIPDLKTLNDILEAEGIPLNDSGGKIKGSVEVGLRQSSTVANEEDFEFSDGVYRIPYSYLEFAERFVEPQYANLPPEQIQPWHYFQGFVPQSADRIFESTYTSQVHKKEQ